MDDYKYDVTRPYKYQIIEAISKTLQKNTFYTSGNIIKLIEPILKTTMAMSSLYSNTHAVLSFFVKKEFMIYDIQDGYKLIINNKDLQRIADEGFVKFSSTKNKIDQSETDESLISMIKNQAKEIENLKTKINIIAAAFCAAGRNIEEKF